MARPFAHTSIMLEACLEHLAPQEGMTFLDGTLGGGGHAEAVLERLGASGRLYGIDRDPEALEAASRRLARFGASFVPVHGNYKDAAALLAQHGVEALDGALLDLGVSSYQLDEPSRGFSYNADAPLDMRMDPSAPYSAYDVVNTLSRERLTEILRRYGEEKWAPRIAQFIVKRREISPIATTGDLVEVILAAIPAGARRGGPHPAKRTFQAIRIEVNGELEGLGDAVTSLIGLLRPGGRLAVITFHSLEDRAVKEAMASAENPCVCPPSAPYCICGRISQGKRIPHKPLVPSAAEIEANPRSRSAKLRIFVKADAEGRVLIDREREYT